LVKSFAAPLNVNSCLREVKVSKPRANKPDSVFHPFGVGRPE